MAHGLPIRIALGALWLASVLDVHEARADDSMRCGNKLVVAGDAPYQVRTVCGNPDDVQQRTVQRMVRRAVTLPCRAGFCQSMVDDTIQVSVEEWTYDFGPQRFVQYVTFENGRLVSVHSGSYGRKPTS